MPLELGTRWRYVVTESVVVGNPRRNPPSTLDVIARGTQRFGSAKFTEVEGMGMLLDGSIEPMFLRAEPGVLYMTSPVFQPLVITVPIFVAPARVGDLVGRRVVLSADTAITVPAGRFRTVRYAQAGKRDDQSSFWFVAPGVGVVRKEFSPVLTLLGDSVLESKRQILSLESLRRP